MQRAGRLSRFGHPVSLEPGTAQVGMRSAGLLAAVTTIVIWAGFLLVTRYAVGGTFTVAEILFLRLVPAAVLIAPVMWRLGVVPRDLSWPRALVIMLGAGVGFPAIMIMGLQFAPASDAGALAPGTLPFWTALAAAVMMGDYPGPRRKIGLALIFAGALVVSLWEIATDAGGGAWRGHLCFLAASGLWGLYTVVFRQSGLSPVHALAIGMFWSVILVLPVLLWFGIPFQGTDLRSIAVMAFLQSIVMAMIALLTYGYAVRVLGAAETGAFGALTPILTLIGGVAFLGEDIGVLKVLGVVIVALGVFTASGVLGRAGPRRTSF